MQKYLRYCPTCAKKYFDPQIYCNLVPGYDDCWLNDEIADHFGTCTRCGGKEEKLDFLCSDYRVIARINKDINDPSLLEAMIQLKKDDIIEFNARMAQFRQALGGYSGEEGEDYIPPTPKITCPKCGSTNVTTGQKGYSFLFGFLGSNETVNRCGHCGYTWKPKG